MWILPDTIKGGATRFEEFRSLFEEDTDHPLILDQIKQVSFYTDCLGSVRWTEPENAIDRATAEMVIRIARTVSRRDQVASREIELWVKHLKPVWMGSMEWMIKAVINWYAEMQAEGLKPEGSNEMDEFLRNGIAALSPSKGSKDGV